MEEEKIDLKDNTQNIRDEKVSENIDDNNESKFFTPKVRSTIFHIVAILSIAIFAICIAPKTLQNDTFYTITIGKYIMENGIGDLTKDMYSWHDLAYTYPHWLYDLMMGVIYSYGGQTGIYISTMVFTIILGLSVYLLCNKKSKNKVVSFAITIGALYLMKTYIAARAQLVTFVLFTWTVYCIERFLETKKLRYAFCLVLFALLVANLHCAVFPFYFVLFLPYIGEYLIVAFDDLNLEFKVARIVLFIKSKIFRKKYSENVYDQKVERLKHLEELKTDKNKKLRANPYKITVVKNHIVLLLISVMLIAACMGILNPAGDGAYTYLWKTMKGNTTSSINEHLPLTFVDNTAFAVSVVLFLMVLIFTDTKIKLSDLFMLVGLTYLAFKSRRQVSMYTLFCAPILATLFADWVRKYDAKTFKKIENFIGDWFGSIVIVCIFIIAGTKIIKPTLTESYIDEAAYPVAASVWINNNLDLDNVRLYNEYNYGSYLLFQGIPVFIDSRCDLYSPEFNGTYNRETKSFDNCRDIFSDALNIASLSINYVDAFNNYGVTHVILYADNKLSMVLSADANYKLLYDDSKFKIFEKLDAKDVNSNKDVDSNVVEDIAE